MKNTIKIDAFPVTEDMYQLKSIDIINSNFLSLKKWHDTFSKFCKLNDDYGRNNIRLYFENVTSIETADLKTDHIQSIDKYEPYGATGEPNRLFEMSRDTLKWKSFVVNKDGMCMPTEAIHKIDTEDDLVKINQDLSDPGRWVNGLIYVILNARNEPSEIRLSNATSVTLRPADAVTLLQFEGIWFKI